MRHYFLLLAVLVFSGALSAQPFQLSGTTKGMPDGTWLYLTLESGESAADSVQVKGNKFQLSGTLPLPLMNVFLHTAGLQQYKGFWMEPGLTTLVMESNALQEAKVTGSKVAADEAMLNKQLRQVLKRMEQIEATAEHEKNDAKRQQLISEYVALEKKQAGIQKQFIRQHPASMYSAHLLSTGAIDWGVDTARHLYGLLAPALQQSVFGQRISRYLALVRQVAVDSMYADVAAPDTSGVIQKLSALQGKWVLLEFWASWCGPCREANPALRQAYDELKGYPFEIFAVSLDKSSTSWRKAIVKDQLPWIHVSQLKQFEDDAALTYGVNAIPTNFLINPQGKIVGIDVDPEELPAIVKGGQKK